MDIIEPQFNLIYIQPVFYYAIVINLNTIKAPTSDFSRDATTSEERYHNSIYI